MCFMNPGPGNKKNCDKIIYLKDETYALVKKYTKLKNDEDEKCENHETRLLELLFKNINFLKYESISEELKERYPTALNLTNNPLNVRDITLKYLRAYAYSCNLSTLDEAIYDCIKKDNQQEKITKMIDALSLQFQKKIEKIEEGK